MTRLAKKFYVGKPILHCLTQNIGLIALFPHKNFKAQFQKRNGAKVIALGFLQNENLHQFFQIQFGGNARNLDCPIFQNLRMHFAENSDLLFAD